MDLIWLAARSVIQQHYVTVEKENVASRSTHFDCGCLSLKKYIEYLWMDTLLHPTIS